jgi:hypothetical protein
MTKLIATVFLAIFLLLLGACALHGQLVKPGVKIGTEQTAQNRRIFIGHWYGDERTTDGGKHQWLIERKDDGAFIIRIRTNGPEGTIDQTEYGSWGVSEKIYFTITSGFLHDGLPDSADPTDPTLYDAYEIVSLTNDSMAYRSLETRDTFTARRVDENYQFPEH